MIFIIDISDPNIRDVCQYEYFSAACGEGHVVVMESAIYGRMRQGRCIKVDYGHIGCFSDVLAFMHSRCSGQRDCEFKPYDTELRQLAECPTDLSNYLEASFTCTRGKNKTMEEL